MKQLRQIVEASLDDLIKQFVNSKHPTFKGASKEERIKRAHGAYNSMKNRTKTPVIINTIDDPDKTTNPYYRKKNGLES